MRSRGGEIAVVQDNRSGWLSYWQAAAWPPCCHGGIGVTLLDVDPRSFAIARRYFHMPPSVECHLADGARFLRRNLDRYDAIVVDAFVEGRIPAHFLTPNFLGLAKARLRRSGIVLVNMVIRGDEDPLFATMAKAMTPVWRYTRLLDVKSFSNRNVIAVAGAVRDLKAPRLRIKPAIQARKLAQSLAGFFFRPLR